MSMAGPRKWRPWLRSFERGDPYGRVQLPGKQPQCRPFARELIAFAGDWPDRDKLWPLVQPLRENGCPGEF